MITAVEMTGERTGGRIEFNPQQDLLGRVIKRPLFPHRHPGHDEWRNRSFGKAA